MYKTSKTKIKYFYKKRTYISKEITIQDIKHYTQAIIHNYSEEILTNAKKDYIIPKFITDCWHDWGLVSSLFWGFHSVYLTLICLMDLVKEVINCINSGPEFFYFNMYITKKQPIGTTTAQEKLVHSKISS